MLGKKAVENPASKVALVLLTILLVASLVGFSGCVTPTTPPEPGEWTAQTGVSEFTFTFTVNPDSTSITEVTCAFEEFDCGLASGVLWPATTIEIDPPSPITDGQFTTVWDIGLPFDVSWDIFVEGQFDETGSHASGTWEVSPEGTTCAEGTWEASAP